MEKTKTKMKKAAAAAAFAALAAVVAAPSAAAATAKATGSTATGFAIEAKGASADGFEIQLDDSKDFAGATTIGVNFKAKKTGESTAYAKLDGKRKKIVLTSWKASGAGLASGWAEESKVGDDAATGEAKASWGRVGAVASAETAIARWTAKTSTFKVRIVLTKEAAKKPTYARIRTTLGGKRGAWSAAALARTGPAKAAKADGTTKATKAKKDAAEARSDARASSDEAKSRVEKKGAVTLYSTTRKKLRLEGATGWRSSNPKVAKVSKDGVVEGGDEGVATITATAPSGKTAAWEARVKAMFNYDSIRMAKGQKFGLNVRGADDLKMKWKSSDAKVAKVDAQGTVTAVAKGTATVTVTYPSQWTRKVKVTVVGKADAVETKRTNLYDGKPIDVDYAIEPASPRLGVGMKETLAVHGRDPGKVEWSSSNPKVAKVSAKGVVTGVKAGTATIVAKTNEMTLETKVKVVKEITTPISWVKKDWNANEPWTQPVNTSRGKINFVLFNQGWEGQHDSWLPPHGCGTCAATTMIRAYTTKKEYKDLTPAQAHAGIFSFCGTRGYGLVVPEFGDPAILKQAGIEGAKYHGGKPSSAAQIEKWLHEGKTLYLQCSGANDNRWASKNNLHKILLLGMTDTGKVIVGDSGIRDAEGQEAGRYRVKLGDADDIYSHMTDQGYILFN